MFHVKQRRRLAGLAGLLALSLLVLSCSKAASPRGWAAPVGLDNLVIVSTSKGHLTAINASSREKIWRFPDCWSVNEKGARSLAGIYGPPVASRDGQTLFVGDYSGYVYAFPTKGYDCDKGSEVKAKAGAFKFDDKVIGGLALDASSDTLYVTSGQRLYSLRAKDLIARIDNSKADVELKEVFKAGGDIWSTPVLTANGLLFSSLDGGLYMIDPSSGRQAWRYSAGRSLASTPVVSGGANGLALVGGFDGELHAVDLATGLAKWSFQATNWVWSSPLVDSGRAYFGDFNSNLYAVDLSSGSEVWSLALGHGPIRSAPALAGGTLVVATEGGWLVGIDPTNQSKKWETRVNSGIAADVSVRNDTVLIAPKGCVKVGDSSEKTYYTGVDPRTGNLTQASGVC
jgi:outer membrane protein assembly factor BamB